MRVAGRLASEVLDFIAPFVKPAVSTGELDRLCHEYMVDVQGTIPAPLNYAPPVELDSAALGSRFVPKCAIHRCRSSRNPNGQSRAGVAASAAQGL